MRRRTTVCSRSGTRLVQLFHADAVPQLVAADAASAAFTSGDASVYASASAAAFCTNAAVAECSVNASVYADAAAASIIDAAAAIECYADEPVYADAAASTINVAATASI